MTLRITGTAEQITAAINSFVYHKGFASVWPWGQQYLKAGPPARAVVDQLAARLREVLLEYGAAEPGILNNGALNAPALNDAATFSTVISDPDLRLKMRSLELYYLPRLTLTGRNRSVFDSCGGESPMRFDELLRDVLINLATGLFDFVGNCTATYPMKSVLLMTGLMPAYDRQVRNGLAAAGLVGFAAPLNLAGDLNTANWKKITRLPFLLGQCWNSNFGVLNAGILRSNFRELLFLPGRVFDVLLFVQGRGIDPITTIAYDGPSDWYELP